MATHFTGTYPVDYQIMDECEHCKDVYAGDDRVQILRLLVPESVMAPNMGPLTFCDFMCLALWVRR